MFQLMFCFMFLGDYSIGIVVYDGVLTSEVTAPAEVFGLAKNVEGSGVSNVSMISLTTSKTVTTAEGLVLVANSIFSGELDLDVLIVPGAYELGAVTSQGSFINALKKHVSEGKWIQSNCSGAFILAFSGVLDGKRATTWSGGEDALKKQYPEIRVQRNQPVVIDGRIITSNGGLVSYTAAMALLESLSNSKVVKEVMDHIQWAQMKQSFSQFAR